MITYTCPGCQQNLQLSDEFAGHQEECPNCGSVFTVPVPPVAPSRYGSPEAPSQEGGTGQAVASLIFGILSYMCFSFLAAVPAVVLGHISLTRIRKGLMPANAWGLAVAGLVLGYVNIVLSLILPVVFIFFAMSANLTHGHGAANRAMCQNNLKQMGIVFKMYSGEHRGYWPSLTATPGRLMPDKDAIIPMYLEDPTVLVCPSEADVAKAKEQGDGSYFYLGYAVANEKEVAVFCKAYRERMGDGLPFDADLQVPMGEGTGGGTSLRRLQEGVERFMITDLSNPAAGALVQSIVPVLIEHPGNHEPSGGNVLYMDGHVEYVTYPGKWPMTEETIDALKQLDALGN